MANIRFSSDYDHRWPSRAMTHFRANGGPHGDGTYIVKEEVAAAAIKAGKATRVPNRAKARTDGAERGPTVGVAGRNPAPDRNDTSGDELEPHAGDRGSDDAPAVPGA